MSRARLVVIVGVIVLANLLVLGNMVLLVLNVDSASTAPVVPSPSARPRSSPTPTVTAPVPSVAPPVASPTAVVSNPAATGAPTLAFSYPFTYTVQRGDTVSTIAVRFKVPAAKIMAANNISDANFVRIGQVLIIPDPNK